MRITAACPANLLDDANALAMVLAFGPSDGATYNGLYWQDDYGNLYAAASWEAAPGFIPRATTALVRPSWDIGTFDESTESYGPPYIVNMDAARRAQAALVFWDGSEQSDVPPKARPNFLTAIRGLSGTESLRLMGLRQIEVREV